MYTVELCERFDCTGQNIKTPTCIAATPTRTAVLAYRWAIYRIAAVLLSITVFVVSIHFDSD